MEEKIMRILDNVQVGSVNHQKNIKLLENIYNSVEYKDFLNLFLRVVQGVLQQDYKNPCLRLLLEYLAKFVGYIARVQNNENVSDVDLPTHPFLVAVIEVVVMHHNLPVPECRYNACTFLSLILQNIGNETQMDSQICDVIQIAMLENIQDFKPVIRLQAASALVRLQDPLNPECPVIRAYITCLKDSSPLVRKEAVKRIAANAFTIPKLTEKTRDIDPNVRRAAFEHVAEIGIKHFKIVHRQFILNSGFSETNRLVKKVFLELLLPKWLTSLNGDYIAFLTIIKLDAEESDILNTEELSKEIMEVYFKTEPIENLIRALPLDENKVIPLNSMRTEISHYWNILINYLRKSEELDEYLDAIIPELTSFCNYLEKLISNKFSKTMDDWEYLDFQYMLYHLFDIAENYDLSEVVGRRTLDNLLKKVLRNHRLQPRLLSKIMQIASKLASSMDLFTNEMCLIISDIREPLIEQEPSVDDQRERDFKMAELKVKINILEGDLEDAVDEKDFQKAQVLKNEIEEYHKRMEALNTRVSQSEKVRVSKDDPETVCWCLDLLAAILINSNLKTLTPSMITCREEFLKLLLQSKNVEVTWRVFKCLAAYCVFDKKMAEDHIKQLMVPIASYRVIPNFNKNVLVTSISIVTDLIRLHGAEFIYSEIDNSTTSSAPNSTRRKLYNEEVDDFDMINNQMTVEIIVNVVLDMLDDENKEIRDTAVVAAAKLMLNEFTITPMVITRLILKWYNPLSQKTLQQKLGMIIKEYTEKIKGSREIVAKSVIPILTNIADAPRTSPLAEVDMENVIRFLAAISDSVETNGIAHAHWDLAHTLIREIASRPAEPVTPYFAKMLIVLNIAPDNLPPTKELIGQAELLLEREALDKGPKQYIIKFINKLNGNLTMTNSINTTNGETSGPSLMDNTRNPVNSRLSSIIEDDEAEIRVGGNDKSRTEESSDDVPRKRRRINSENPNEIVMEKTTGRNREISSKNTYKNKTDDQSNVVEPASDPNVISPSISPVSQEETINNLRKRTRSSNNVEITEQIKKKVITKGVNATTEGKRINEFSVNHEKNKENLIDKEMGNAKNARKKETADTCNNHAKDKDKSNKSKKGTKNSDKESSISGPRAGENIRKELRVVLSNIEVAYKLRNKDKRQGPVRSDKKDSPEIPVSAESSFEGDTEQPTATSEQNLNKNSQVPINGLRVGTHSTTDDVSTSSDPASGGSRNKRGRPRKKMKTLDHIPSKTNKITGNERRLLEDTSDKRTNSVVNTPRSSASESSATTRSRSSSTSSTPIIGKYRNTKNNKKVNAGDQSRNKRGRPKKTKARTQTTHLSSSLSTSSLRSESSCEEDVVAENRLRPKENDRKVASNTKDCSTSKPAENSKTPRKGRFLNTSATTSESSGVDKENKGSSKRRGRKKKEQGLNNNGVGEKEVEIRANGVQKTVPKQINTPQVKRKKGRRPKDKKVTEGLKSIISEELSDSSNQSLHTIIEPSDIQMSVLPDESPSNSLQKSFNHHRRLQVVSETTSDSDSASSPVRRSSRKSKVYKRF